MAAAPTGDPPRPCPTAAAVSGKDRCWRFHDISDVRIALEDAAIEPFRAVAPPRQPPRLAWIAVALFGAATGAAIVATVQSRRPVPRQDTITVELTAPPGSQFSQSPNAALSPDGRSVLLLAGPGIEKDLWLHSFTTGTARQLPGTGGAAWPFWSPDGRAAAFFAGGKLKKIDTVGAAGPVELCDVPITRGGTWNARNEIVFANVAGPLQRIAAAGGTPSALTRLDVSRGDVAHIRPQFLPDGRHVLFTAAGKVLEARVVSLDDPGSEQRLGIDAVAVYSAGHLVFHERGSLVAQPFDPSTRTLTGQAATLVQRTAGEPTWNVLTPFSASASNMLSYATVHPGVCAVDMVRSAPATVSGSSVKRLNMRTWLEPGREAAGSFEAPRSVRRGQPVGARPDSCVHRADHSTAARACRSCVGRRTANG